MDQTTANNLIDKTGTLLCLDVPSNILFGIDNQYWTTSDQFKGLKLIPPGPHFVYFSVPNKYGGEGGLRVGLWVCFAYNEVKVWKWDPLQEDFITEQLMDKDEVDRYKAGVKRFDFDSNLGPYPVQLFKRWYNLSNHINSSTITEIVTKNHRISATTKSTQDLEGEGLYQSPSDLQEYSTFRYKDFTKIVKIDDTADRTKMNFDKSYRLYQLVEVFKGDEMRVLAELQFSFVCFLVGLSFESFEQWRKVVEMLCKCDDAIAIYPKLFSRFCDILLHQIAEVDDDFFDDIVTGDNFLLQSLKDFIEIGSQADDLTFLDNLHTLKDYVETRFKLKIGVSDEEGNIVSLEELQEQTGLSMEEVLELIESL
eukprot:TRINITY_DN9176_c0_g1_i1.p1 TRINITY_DN9176_c0_g1~~TRINITY_DN9176_c0_g1_i1.p1  ORF type:complete len:367 (+),score=68.09 TRINITY_DN9176_c0_g1_i1:39-1139(+)